jgi:diguanylate cyclase (GGDEF)-like protein
VAFLQPHYDLRLVVVSVLIASLAAYVALDLARRVRSRDPVVVLCWGVGGSVAMGTGIWAMHFIGMMAFSLPFTLGYTFGMTALSWLAAVAVSGVALTLANCRVLGLMRLALGSLVMGAGICAMHYTGMAALDLAPGIVWDVGLVAASAAVAVAASAAALVIFFWLRHRIGAHGRAWQAAAAVFMGLAIAGTHYTGMAAAGFPAGMLCLSANALGANSLSGIVIVATATLLLLTLFTSMLDGSLRDRATRLAARLQAANDELHAANVELKALALRDPLSGLPNRLMFEDRLRQAVARADQARHSRDGGHDRLAVLFIDLDGFKPVNESLGHTQGDQVLRDTAGRLRGVARGSDTVARVGGDQFVLMMASTGGREDCITLARRIVDVLGEPLQVGHRCFSISASVGIVIYPDNGSADRLLAHAEAAMCAAKRAGGGTWAFFEPHMVAGALEQLSLQTDLRQAIEQGQLHLHYQPKVDARSGALTGLEALLRWQHPQRGAVSPALFIPIAERFGLIGALGDWVIEEACRQMGAWAAAGTPLRVAVNLSVHQLRQDDLAGRIEKALQRHGIAPADLLCEVTESAAMDDLHDSRLAFEGLLRIGVFLSIDDFGTGHSSLSYLRRLPARQLKIDRSFVGDLESSADARAIVQAVLGMAHALGLRVVAEGVETAGQRDILVALGCDELQGYFFARPMAPDALPAWLARRAAAGQAADPASAVSGPSDGERFADEVEPVLAEVHG